MLEVLWVKLSEANYTSSPTGLLRTIQVSASSLDFGPKSPSFVVHWNSKTKTIHIRQSVRLRLCLLQEKTVLEASNHQSVVQLCAKNHTAGAQQELHLAVSASKHGTMPLLDEQGTLILCHWLEKCVRCRKAAETSYATIEHLVYRLVGEIQYLW